MRASGEPGTRVVSRRASGEPGMGVVKQAGPEESRDEWRASGRPGTGVMRRASGEPGTGSGEQAGLWESQGGSGEQAGLRRAGDGSGEQVDLLVSTASRTDWTYVTEERRIAILRCMDTPVHCVKGVATLPFSPKEIFDTIKDPRSRHGYDNMVKSVRVVAQGPEEAGVSVAHIHHHTNQCLVGYGRDFCVLHQASKLEGRADTYIVAGQSIEHSLCPQQPGVSRGRVVISGWIISPVKSQGSVMSRVTHLTQVDLKGVPNTLINLVSRRQPLCIYHLKKLMIKNQWASTGASNTRSPQSPARRPSLDPSDLRKMAHGNNELMRQSFDANDRTSLDLSPSKLAY
ncbi:hypothetical protein CYMTET_16761 [Cymbomonas tetramitiformis]|uniref:START domain-containing protein n=1 Tax=Cymbomonas tetramitiformis TaxID=36881 RepID=A0AAE0GBI6_9CHLO|nr:hypothetical protein CYMTET_16761 [Cymbomonas tetramitiformis]